MIRLVTLTLGPVVLASVVGLLTGMTGSDANVLAAVLPAVLAAGGGIIFAYPKLRNGKTSEKDNKSSEKDKRTYTINSGIVAIFALSFLFAAFIGNYLKEKSDAKLLKDLHEATEIRIEKCSGLQYMINKERKIVNLEPLSFQEVCPNLSRGFSEE